MENLFIGIIIVAVVFGIAVMLYVNYLDRGPENDDLDNLDIWFNDHQFCPICGRELAWVSEDKIKYDTADGRPYHKQDWSCVIANHTLYGRSRRNYETPA